MEDSCGLKVWFRGKNFFKDPVYNEPLPYGNMPTGPPPMPRSMNKKKGYGASRVGQPR